MNKKIFTLITILAVCFMLTVGVTAEYIPCKDVNTEHDMSKWVQAGNDDGTFVMERTCSLCDWTQRGFNSDGDDEIVMTTRGMPIAPSEESPSNFNPSTGAIA